ncbi:MAG: hypothetical protein JXA71_01685 [Chitinispirillaceae bacterium]|nr:hypothetical protein [Chitinispirillaceae bacterium]
MKKQQSIAVSFAIFLSVATAFPFPMQKKHGFPIRMLSHSAMIAHAPKPSGETVTHLVQDSAVDETGGGDIYKIKYNEKGQIESVDIEFSMENISATESMIFYYNVKGDVDSLRVSLKQDDGIVAELRWIFTVPLDRNWAPATFDQMAIGQGVRRYMDFSSSLCPTSGYSMEKYDDVIGWRYGEKDSIIDDSSGTRIYLRYEWDTISSSWIIKEIDTLTISNTNVTLAIQDDRSGSSWRQYRYSYFYDVQGEVIEYNRDILEYINRIWQPYQKQKYLLTYNDHNHLTSSRMQEWDSFSGTWTSIDSGSFAFHSYTYDGSENVIVRIDSTMDYWDTEPSSVTRYFKYQTFSAPVIPANVSKKILRQPVIVSSDGKIKLQSAGKENLSATLYTLSGRSLCRIPLRTGLRLNDYCSQNGIHPGRGASLLRIKSDKTGQHIGEWMVFFR